MMRRGQRAALLASAALAALALAGCGSERGVPPSVESPNRLSSAELVERMKEYDGMTVAFEGEAVGEAMVRDDGVWIHLNDDAYYERNIEEGAPLGGQNTGMPVWVRASDARRISVFGDYKHEGDVVRVEGVFHAACPEHGGDTDIHATSLTIVRRGHAVVDEPKPEKMLLAAVLSLLAGALYLTERATAGGLRG